MLIRVTFPLAAAHFVNQAARTMMAIVGPLLAVELGLSAVELGTLADGGEQRQPALGDRRAVEQCLV